MTLNETEQKYFSQLFSIADVDRDGKVSGKEGAPFLRKSELSDKALEKIWEVADSQVTGFLGPREFAIAMRLVAHAQNTVSTHKRTNGAGPAPEPEIKIGNIKSVTSLPKFKDIPTPVMFPAIFSSEDVHKYDHLFIHADLNKDGYIDGSEAKAYFSKAKINTDKLARIWELSELDGDSKLNYSEFRLAMHLIYWSLKNEELPTSLPASLIEASKTIPPAAQMSAAAQFMTGGSFNNQLGAPMSNQMTNQMPNQMTNQMPNQMPNQMGNQMSNQMSNQMPNQMSNQMNSGMNNQFPYGNNQMQFANNGQGNMGGNVFQGNFENFDNNYSTGGMGGNQPYYNQPNMSNYNQQNQQMGGMVNQGFVQAPVKMSDPSIRPNVYQHALPGASFEARANFQNDLSQAMNARQKK